MAVVAISGIGVFLQYKVELREKLRFLREVIVEFRDCCHPCKGLIERSAFASAKCRLFKYMCASLRSSR
jgi:hypothetical protein